jgi:hypothetical protein
MPWQGGGSATRLNFPGNAVSPETHRVAAGRVAFTVTPSGVDRPRGRASGCPAGVPIDDGGALAMETARFRDIHNRMRPRQSLGDRVPLEAYVPGR